MAAFDKSTLNVDGRPMLKDSDPWTKIPFQVSLGKRFTSLRDALAERMITFGVHKHRTNFKAGMDNQNNFERFGIDPDSEEFLEESPVVNDYVRTTYFKDTCCGGNDAINCVWQFGRDDDIVHPMLRSRSDQSNIGMGRVYAATTETNQQILWMTFGTAVYSDIGSFLGNAFSKDLAILNEYGVLGNDNGSSELDISGSIFGALGHAVGLVISIPLFPFVWFHKFANRLTNYPCGKYYDLRATMHLYYTTVDNILAQWLVSTGIYGNSNDSLNKQYGNGYDPRVANPYNPAGSSGSSGTGEMGNTVDLTGAGEYTIASDIGNNEMASLNTYNDEVRAKAGKVVDYEEYNQTISGWTADPDSLPLAIRLIGPSIFDIMTNRLRTLAIRQSTHASNIRSAYKSLIGNDPEAGYPIETLSQRVAEMYKLSPDQYDTGGANPAEAEELTAGWKSGTDWTGEFSAAALGGLQFVGFRIDKSVSADESFSNSTQPSALAEQINSSIQAAASKLYDTGGKVVSAESALGKFVEGVTDIVSGTVGKLFDSFDAVNTGAAIDIPERYSGSDFSKSHSFKLTLSSPNGDIVSIYQSIMVPLALLLAAAVPRAAGPNSYQSPFLLRAYCKGMFAIPLGIIESMNITRGSEEFGWNYQNLPTTVDVNISIKDLAPAMYLSIKDPSIMDTFGANSNFNEYMLTLAGVGLWERISFFSKLQRNTQLFFHKLRNRYTNPNYWTSTLSETSLVRVVASFVPDTAVSYD